MNIHRNTRLGVPVAVAPAIHARVTMHNSLIDIVMTDSIFYMLIPPTTRKQATSKNVRGVHVSHGVHDTRLQRDVKSP